MNSNESGNQEPKKYDFGFNDACFLASSPIKISLSVKSPITDLKTETKEISSIGLSKILSKLIII